MSEHFSDEIIRRYRNGEMEPAELLEADDHLTACGACASSVATAKKVSESSLEYLRISPIEQDSTHLSYEELESYVDGKRDAIGREIADVHLEICAGCAAQLQGLVEMRKLIDADTLAQTRRQNDGESIFAGLRNFLTGDNFFRYGFAGLAGLILVSIAVIFWNSRRPPSPAEIAVSSPPLIIDSPENRVETAPLPAAENRQNTNIIAGSNENIVNSSNKINSPVNQINANDAPKYQIEIQQALVGQRLNLPAELNRLDNQTGKLMSGGSEQIPFALSSPVGKIIQTDRPQFHWRPLEGAEGYVLNIYDTNFQKIAASPLITETAWQIDNPLARGKIYLWQVTAIKGGQEIKSPARPAPDARFKIIDAGKAAELTEARRKFKDSPLSIGILYANAGLLDEAEREFQREINRNPQSKTAQKFLDDLRARRKTD